MVTHSCCLILGSDEYSSLSEEERGNSKPRTWSKYPLDVQKEFGYDSPHDLDSDWSCDIPVGSVTAVSAPQ